MKHRKLVYLLVVALVSCSGPEPRKPVIRKTASMNSESVEINKKINDLEEAALQAYAKKDSLYVYASSAHGFWYAVTSEGNPDRKIAAGDQILFTTEIVDLNDNIIYSKEEIGVQSYMVDKENIVKGLRDGLKLMHENEAVKFLFPSHKVFGFSGNNDRITHNQPLVYYIKIIKINREHESN